MLMRIWRRRTPVAIWANWFSVDIVEKAHAMAQRRKVSHKLLISAILNPLFASAPLREVLVVKTRAALLLFRLMGGIHFPASPSRISQSWRLPSTVGFLCFLNRVSLMAGCAPALSLFNHPEIISVSNQDGVRHSQEQAGPHHPGNRTDLRL
jgi:hypothetical protein